MFIVFDFAVKCDLYFYLYVKEVWFEGLII